MKTELLNILVFAVGDIENKLVMSNNFNILLSLQNHKFYYLLFYIQCIINDCDLTLCNALNSFMYYLLIK